VVLFQIVCRWVAPAAFPKESNVHTNRITELAADNPGVLDRLHSQQPYTWAWLTAREPRLTTLAADILRGAVPERMPEFWRVWTRDFKSRLVLLVGWDCSHPDPAMHSTEAYCAAFDYCWRLYTDAAEINDELRGGAA
jgi:hypothetical protein